MEQDLQLEGSQHYAQAPATITHIQSLPQQPGSERNNGFGSRFWEQGTFIEMMSFTSYNITVFEK